MGLEYFLPFKIGSNFNSSNKFTKVFAIPIIYIIAPPNFFALPYTTPDHVRIAYLTDYRCLHLSNLGKVLDHEAHLKSSFVSFS